jgi:HEAT repeat protein
VASGLWGVWGQSVGIGSAVFTGFALSIGADAAYIALLTSVAYALATIQFVSPLIGQRIRSRKHFILGMGFGEVVLRGAVVFIPLFLVGPAFRLHALLLITALSLACGHIISPLFNTWVANTVPTKIRARFISQQTTISTVVAVVAGFAMGWFLDLFPVGEQQSGFVVVFAVGAVFGLLGYLALTRAPFAQGSEARKEPSSNFRMFAAPFADANFRQAVLFNGSWAFAVGLAAPLYGVYMLENLGISYTEISVFNAAFMVTSIVGYRSWAALVDRFGSKPVLQILLVPAALTPILWVFTAPGAYYLVPVALLVSGFIFSGIAVAITPLQYGLMPEGEQRPYYMATWSAASSLFAALGPLAGSLLVTALREAEFEIGGFRLGNLQIIFLLGMGFRLLPFLPLRSVQEGSSVTSRALLLQMFRGNLMSYAYNATVYSLASGERRRARAALALGRSGSPLAIDQLIQALADASPLVRQSAARALGETGSESASQRLLQELVDGASDIRPEAAEALGRLGHAGSVDSLVDALEDGDTRVRISAIRGLAEMGGPEGQELLFWHLSEGFDANTFPTLVDALGQLGDHRVVKHTLRRLPEFPSAAVQLQLLNSICRALGAGGLFYQLMSFDDTRRISDISRMLKRATSLLAGSEALQSVRGALSEACGALSKGYDEEDLERMQRQTRLVAGLIRDGLSVAGKPPYEVLSIFLVILAIDDFLKLETSPQLHSAKEVFIAVCLSRISALVGRLQS